MIYDVEKFNLLREEVEAESEIVNAFLREILSLYCSDLDGLIDEMNMLLEAIKDGDIDEFTDNQLEYYSMKLPVLLYNAGNRLGELGANSDVAKANRKKLFNVVTLKMRKETGTVIEKKAIAENLVGNEQMVEDLYYRAYCQLKVNLEYADGVFTSVKKVISKRMIELQVFYKDNGKDGKLGEVDNSIQEDGTWKEYKQRRQR